VRILLIDNYDSFAYNLVQAEVFRNDALSVADALTRPHDRLVVSPGPCTPAEAGISVELCRRAERPLLGVCLGHQCLVAAFGGVVDRAERVRHGKTSAIAHDGRGLFAGLPEPIEAARYHSLIAREIPDCFEIVARAADFGECMAVRHSERPLFGVQFHPESFLTPHGPRLLQNFLEFKA
jgi:anthranilate synthase component 2